MYPNLYYAFKDLFGIEINALKLINSFGFFVAIAFICSGYVLYTELKRKAALGQFTATEEKEIIGAPASLWDLFSAGFFGFLFGYKILGAFLVDNALDNPQSFILSFNGSIGAGVLVAAMMIYLKWKEKEKQKLASPETKIMQVWPHDRVGDIVLQAALWGFLGAKIFHNLENLEEFARDPIGSLISFSGLTFFGGLILATIAIVIYLKKLKINVIHFADSMAPTMLFAYAAGRIGCQISGDGDWGIPNPNPKPFTWMPDWLWSYHYPNNVLNEGVRIMGCEGNYCNQLPFGVYPTALYEIIAMFILFGIVWMIRKKITQPGILTGIYFIFAGSERFLIEKIRINNVYEQLPFKPTQAELIATILILLGVLFLIKSKSWFPIQSSNTK